MRYWTASRDETTERELTPRRVFHERGEWYVAGDDHRSGEYRTFRIDRVESIERTGEFDDPVDDADDPRLVGRRGRPTGRCPRVTVRLQPAARWVVEEYPVDAVTELGDGVVEARFAVVSEHNRGRRAGDSGSGEWSEEATGRIEAEVETILTRAFNHAVDTLSRRRAVLDGMAEALLVQGSLEREEFLALLGEAA